MKLKEILKVAGVSALAIGLFSAAFIGINSLAFAANANASTPLAPIESQEITSPAVSVQNAAQRLATTESTIFVPPDATIVVSPFQRDEIPASAIPIEEAAHLGAEYIWDVFGVSIDGMYVVMSYMECWDRANMGRWHGNVTLPRDENSMGFADDWQWGENIFFFGIDSITGERLHIAYNSPRGNHPPQVIEHDTRPLWESAQGQAIRAMSGYEVADFIGMTREEIEAHRLEATAFAQAHFINADIVSVDLGVTFDTPTGPMSLPGISVLLDTDAQGNIFGTFETIEFVATDDTGNEARISIGDWLGFRSISVVTVFPENPQNRTVRRPSETYESQSVHYFQTRTIPAHLREMWEADDAMVRERLELNRRGVAADDFPYYGLWTRWELLEGIIWVMPVEMRHLEMERDELAARMHVGIMVSRLAYSYMDEANMENFFGWARENYTEERIAIYEELGAPDWLVDRLRTEIAAQ